MYALRAIQFTQGAGDIVISQITRQTIDPVLQHYLGGGSSEIDPQFIANLHQPIVVSFGTTALKAVIDLCGVGGMAVDSSLASYEAAELWFAKYADQGEFESFTAGTHHIKMSVHLGMLYWTAIDGRADSPDPAEVDVTLIVLSDGTNAPIMIEKDQAWGPTMPSPEVAFVAGDVWLNGVQKQVSSLRVSTGIQAARRKLTGGVYPTMCGIRQRRFTVEYGIPDLSELDDDSPGLGISGIAMTGVNRCFFQKITDDAMLVTPATAEHVRFDYTAGVHHAASVGLTSGTEAITPVVSRPRGTVTSSTVKAIGAGA